MTQPSSYSGCRGWMRPLKALPSSAYLESEKFIHLVGCLTIPSPLHPSALNLMKLLQNDPHSNVLFDLKLDLKSGILSPTDTQLSLNYTPNLQSQSRRWGLTLKLRPSKTYSHGVPCHIPHKHSSPFHPTLVFILYKEMDLCSIWSPGRIPHHQKIWNPIQNEPMDIGQSGGGRGRGY